MEVLVVDYGAGNLTSVARALQVSGASPVIGAGAAAIARASAIVIPGVGHFSQTASIDAAARAAIAASITRGMPVLGICLGLQWLFAGSDEAPAVSGLGILPGRCFDLGSDTGQTRVRPVSGTGLTPIKVPHVGWNTVDRASRPTRLLDGVPPSAFAYFTHSYAAPIVDDTVATTSHGAAFTSVVERGRVFGAQFHPEKSGEMGLRVLANFVRLAAGAC